MPIKLLDPQIKIINYDDLAILQVRYQTQKTINTNFIIPKLTDLHPCSTVI